MYLNRGWEEQWGGALELWNADSDRREVRVPPLFNRCVVFTTSDRSFHGHPEPLACPEGVTRKSMALYYSAPLDITAEPHGHNTLFRKDGSGQGSWARELVPPLALRAARRIRARSRAR